MSDESVLEAYFLGQRHDGSLEGLVEKSTRRFPAPKPGPYISSVMFVTPFVNAALLSNNYLGNYSAQQAELDHRQAGKEIVEVAVQIQFYGNLRPVYRRSQAEFALRFHVGFDSAT